MAHEITYRDWLVLTGTRAWHGLGTVVKDAPTPQQALQLAGLDWTVETGILSAHHNGTQTWIDSHVALMRGQAILGIVSEKYQPIQNRELAEFAYALGGGGEVLVETAGSIRGGRRVWFLLQGQAFAPIGEDLVHPYVLVSNGHDGSSALRVTPTSVRVVCSNTLHQVIPRGDSGSYESQAWVARHTSGLNTRVAEARAALGRFLRTTQTFREQCESLAFKQANQDRVKEYFARAWDATFGTPEASPKDGKQANKLAKMESAAASFVRRFDDERKLAGTTMWNAFNAFSGLVQHDMKSRGKDDLDRVDKRIDSNLFGLSSERTSAAFAIALSMAS